MADIGATDNGMNIEHSNPPPYPSGGRSINPKGDTIHIKGGGDPKPVKDNS
jgi:hypothetical protein